MSLPYLETSRDSLWLLDQNPNSPTTYKILMPRPSLLLSPAHTPVQLHHIFQQVLDFLVSYESLCLFPHGFLCWTRSICCPSQFPQVLPACSFSVCFTCPSSVGFVLIPSWNRLFVFSQHFVPPPFGSAFRVCISEIVCTPVFLFFLLCVPSTVYSWMVWILFSVICLLTLSANC